MEFGADHDLAAVIEVTGMLFCFSNKITYYSPSAGRTGTFFNNFRTALFFSEEI